MGNPAQTDRTAPPARLLPMPPSQAAGKLTGSGTTPGFVLNGEGIQCGDALAVRVFGAWVAGHVARDHGGWYLLTAAQVGIRLSAGLTARWEAVRGEQGSTDTTRRSQQEDGSESAFVCGVLTGARPAPMREASKGRSTEQEAFHVVR